ncbi:MAG: hypothetical protein HY954_03945 [Deltaproteobacteria bacterium]|nr:hypothetical protein [Deltaproteobacteria bacterium]
MEKTLRFTITVFLSNLLIALTCLPLFVHASGPEAISIDDINIDTGEYERLLKGMPMSIDPAMLEKAKQVIPGDINEKVERERFKLIERDFQNMEEAGGVSWKNQGQAGNALHDRAILKEDERIYIFISSSIPKETLRNYARNLDALGETRISMVMRGFVGGMTKARPTLEFLKGVLFKDGNCDSEKCDAYHAQVLIDPLLFRRYGIEAVPAIVYARKIGGMDSTVSEGVKKAAEMGDYYMLYGDAALDGALEFINREAKTKSLDCLVWKIRRGHYYERDCK